MEKPNVLVRKSPDGYRWKVLQDGQTVGTGTAKTEFEARNAANETVARLVRTRLEGS